MELLVELAVFDCLGVREEDERTRLVDGVVVDDLELELLEIASCLGCLDRPPLPSLLEAGAASLLLSWEGWNEIMEWRG